MKIKKAVLQAMAIAVTVSVTTTACTKEKLENLKEKVGIEKKENPAYDCPACGMG
jgi:transposase-like protein